ncbi:YchJ family protein [Streptomyces odonnellii]|uniref:YchJ family protein n=1 Tax=Streptomyces odonnellii TaxID=1417980 RepID=UPI0007C64766
MPAAYGACCGRFHSGAATAATPSTGTTPPGPVTPPAAVTPPTAELLMRSRYSAFAVGDEPYLLRSWAPATRPPGVDLDPAVRWTGLEILETTDGTPFHTTGTVTFRARFTHRGKPGVLSERSRFARHEGAWVYVDGTVAE